ncbi:MAG: C40 family peptidase [Clostridium sp.]
MSFKSKVTIKTLVVISICILSMLSFSKEAKAETTAQTKKAAVLKTSNLKVDKIIVAQGGEAAKEEVLSHGLSRGTTSVASQIVTNAYEQLGSPYVWGATGPDAFDCSGLITYVYGNSGIYLPRTSSSQYYAGTNISMDELMPGDLVFFDTYGSLSHVGIYIGGGDFIHAGTTSVVVSSLYEGYYSSRYAGATRVL